MAARHCSICGGGYREVFKLDGWEYIRQRGQKGNSKPLKRRLCKYCVTPAMTVAAIARIDIAGQNHHAIVVAQVEKAKQKMIEPPKERKKA